MLIKSIESVFQDFSLKVLGENTRMHSKMQVLVFMNVLRGNDERVRLHVDKDNVLIFDGVEYSIRSSQEYVDFVKTIGFNDTDYLSISSIADSLMLEQDRRLSGDFWTPKIWVDKAHEMISEQLGSDWKNNYVVWDCAAGALNLTRDYTFDNLYSSTLYSEDLGIAEGYNTEAKKFQYNFLDDDTEIHSLTREDFDKNPSLFSSFKMPESLLRALYENKPIVFFSNPPYGTVDNATKSGGVSIVHNKIREYMIDNGGQGQAEREMYTQFIYRVTLFARLFEYTSDYHIFFFNKCFIPNPTYNKFVNTLLSDFTFKNGFMMKGNEFHGTASTWSVIFSHFEIGSSQQLEFPYKVLKSNKNGEIEKFTEWTAFAIDKKETISEWAKEHLELGMVNKNAPYTKNGFDNPTSGVKVKARENTIGYVSNHSANIQHTDRGVSLFSMTFSAGQGYPIKKENLIRALITFAIRRAVYDDVRIKKQLWVKDKDIFLKPSDNLEKDKKFITDCIIYSLYEKQSYQTSLRDYEYNGEKYRVENNFFPFSKNMIQELAKKHDNQVILDDISNPDDSGERLIYQYLQDNKEYISPEALQVLNMAKEITIDSFHLRKVFDPINPRYQVNTWDSGWVQTYRMVFGRDRYNDDFYHMKKEWFDNVGKLVEKISQRAYEDGIITPPVILDNNNPINTEYTENVLQRLQEIRSMP